MHQKEPGFHRELGFLTRRNGIQYLPYQLVRPHLFSIHGIVTWKMFNNFQWFSVSPTKVMLTADVKLHQSVIVIESCLLRRSIIIFRRVSSRAPTKQKSQLTYRELLPAIPIYLPFLRDKLYKCT